jgi:diguanylate cyclase (GGDEF)-like protein
MDKDIQYIKSVQGFDVSEAPRNISFCGHTIFGQAPLIVPDTLKDPRFADNPWVANDPKVRFYAGYPIRGPKNGSILGTVCLYDMKPRTLGNTELILLRDLAILIEESLAIENNNHVVKRLRRKTSELTQYIDYSPSLIYWAQLSGKIVYVNATLMHRLGYPIGQPPTHIDQILDSNSMDDRRKSNQLGDANLSIQRLSTKAGEVVLTKGEGIPGEYESLPVVRWTLRDVEAEIQREKRLRQAAEIDPLCQVYNRRGFSRSFNELKDNLSDKQPLCFGVVDLDSLKQINDIHGHEAGDTAIRLVSDTIQKNLRSTDILGRIGGDEFCVALADIQISDAKEIFSRVQRQLRCSTSENFEASVSVGVVELTKEIETKEAFNLADKLLYRAKSDGRNIITTDVVR